MIGYGERLALALKRKNLKQSELAEKLKIARTAVSKIINGTQYLDFDLAVRTCEILEISLDWLAYGNEGHNAIYHRNPDRQRIEYLLSIIREAEYPLLIVAMEEIIEIRLKGTRQDKPGKPKV
ncbi:MAG: helix-turn-helix domain-containing protein [Treponema sp.]|jgi:transcriptional regulator with XRE-family HTH domain|nr:helix-turn-helix domain-containing protein [Treponema sp.]